MAEGCIMLQEVFRLSPAVRYRMVGDECVVVQQEAAEVLVVNEVGAKVLGLVDGHRTLREVADRVSRDYGTDAGQVAADIEVYARGLLDSGVIERTTDGEAQP